MNRYFILPMLSLLLTISAHANVTHVPIKSAVQLAPGESETVTVESNDPVEIGWEAIQKPACKTNCVEATELTGGFNNKIATNLGASAKYTPAEGKVKIEYRNVSKDPVTINVFSLKRTCEAESCA